MRRLRQRHGATEMPRRGRDPLYWARGRLIALRPDGASKTFDPEAIRVIRTPEEHDEFAVTLTAVYKEARRRAELGLPPAWLDPGAEVNGSSNGHHQDVPGEASPGPEEGFDRDSDLA